MFVNFQNISFFNVLFSVLLGNNYIESLRPLTGDSMERKDDEMKPLLNENVLESQKKVERIEYVMDFGKVYIQYDFCLN